jgi:conjugative relaxase-like TrwC/TraI family protein
VVVLVVLALGVVSGCRWLLMVASVAAIRAGDDAGASVAYYVDQVSHDRHDYYAGHGEASGVWHGAFADHLGLSGHVAAEDFRAVLEGREPTNGEPLKPRADRRVAAWDVTFSPPKSISVLWALAQEGARHQVSEAQAAAVDAAIGYLTAHACVARLGRVGVDRQDGSDLGFLRAEFTHRCSREGDPQLHSHSILVNVLEAPDGGLLFQHVKAADGIYQAALRAELTRRLGVGWERREEQWEVAGIPPGLCREWSKRRSQITAALVARGIDPDTASGRATQTAALATRHAKVHVGDREALHDRFAREAIAAGQRLAQIRDSNGELLRRTYAQLTAHGFDLVPFEIGVEHARRLRAGYSPRMEFLIDYLLAPRGFWSPSQIDVPLLSATHPEVLHIRADRGRHTIRARRNHRTASSQDSAAVVTSTATLTATWIGSPMPSAAARSSATRWVMGLISDGHRSQAGASVRGKKAQDTRKSGRKTLATRNGNCSMLRSRAPSAANRQAKANPASQPMNGTRTAVGTRCTPNAAATTTVATATPAARRPVQAASPVTISATSMGVPSSAS